MPPSGALACSFARRLAAPRRLAAALAAAAPSEDTPAPPPVEILTARASNGGVTPVARAPPSTARVQSRRRANVGRGLSRERAPRLVVVTRANDTRRFAPRAVTRPVGREG